MAAPNLSIVIPTYNEQENIGLLVLALHELHDEPEIIVVDDDSKDGTAEAARQAGARVIVRTTERGLGTAVVRGMQEATGRFVLVMDADWQHPPEVTKRMYETAEAEAADLVIGSRYTDGGSEGGFGALRRLISWGAAVLARMALPPVRVHRLTDPMSGLFLVRRDAVDSATLRPTGYKILLEVLARASLHRIKEVGYTFGDRLGGDSKLGASVIGQYLVHVLALARVHPDNRRVLRASVMAVVGIAVNLGLLFALLQWSDIHYLPSAAIAAESGLITYFLANTLRTPHDAVRDRALLRFARFTLHSLVGLLVYLITVGLLVTYPGTPHMISAFIAVPVAITVQLLYGRLRGPPPKTGPE